MKNGIKRIGKGLFAIFMIKLTLLSGVLIFQACQTDSTFEDENDKELKSSFIEALNESSEKLREINIIKSNYKGDKKGNDLSKENTDEILTFKMCLLLNQDDSNGSSNTGVIDATDVDTIGEVIDLGNDSGTRPVVVDDNEGNVANDPVAFGFSMCFDIPQEPTVEAMDPAIQAARNFLLSRELTETDIVEALDGADESAMIPLVHAILVVEAEAEGLVYNDELELMSSMFGVQTANAQNWGIISGCAISTLGLDSLADLRDALDGKKVKGRALKKAFKKVAKKFVAGLTGWGTILLVAEFGICVAAGHAL
ncbi:hypothetical protein U8527_01820 [Kordia algicida OT-1]|uniref:Uncharacterized protein n=1 Tax=Kordia algicida OT-1 TaxID=391587 RepID=A9DT89_9FLAO|nr:hypothetical protein [Kordia algicida]EDP97040.1 hypothetical protein KAOT1_17793 [Kordia algicida OT-1]